MKKVMLIAVMAIFSSGVFAAKANLVRSENKVESKIENKVDISIKASSIKSKNNVTIKSHVGGTFTSSCGDVWEINYNCDKCSFGTVIKEMMQLLAKCEAACGTDIDYVSL